MFYDSYTQNIYAVYGVQVLDRLWSYERAEST